jgi:hypothetical protein
MIGVSTREFKLGEFGPRPEQAGPKGGRLSGRSAPDGDEAMSGMRRIVRGRPLVDVGVEGFRFVRASGCPHTIGTTTGQTYYAGRESP